MAVMSFNNTGSSVKSALNYFESDRDHTNKERINKPCLISGDKERMLDAENLAKSTGRKCTHTSLTISFRDNELNEFILKNEDGSQQGRKNKDGKFIPEYDNEKLKTYLEENVIKDFRDTFFNGLNHDENYLDYFNIHTDKGNVELNCAFLKMELTTGRQFNPFPPGQLSLDLRDNFVDILNDKLGFERVIRDPFAIKHNDLEMKDIRNPSPTAQYQKEIVKPKKNEIQRYVSKLVLDGELNNRQELIQYLQKNGEVKFLDKENDPVNQKTGKHSYDYISFVPTGFDKAIRLEGELFKKDANFEDLRIEHKNNEKIKNDPLLSTSLTNDERKDKVEKLEKHKSISKQNNEKLKSKGTKSIKKNKSRKYVPKSKKKLTKKDDKKNDKKSSPNSNDQQQPQPKKDGPAQSPAQTVEDNIKMCKEVSIDKAKDDLSDLKAKNKDDLKNKPTDPKINFNSNNSNDDKPSIKIPSHSGNGASAGIEKAIAGLDKQILSINNSILGLQLRIGSLNMMKASDIKIKFELMGKIAELQSQILQKQAEKESKASELIQAKTDELNKGNNFTPSTPKPKF